MMVGVIRLNSDTVQNPRKFSKVCAMTRENLSLRWSEKLKMSYNAIISEVYTTSRKSLYVATNL